VDLALPRRILLWLSPHPDDVLGVRQPRGDQVHPSIDKGAGRPIHIGNPERLAMVNLFHVYQLFPVRGAAALGMSELMAFEPSSFMR